GAAYGYALLWALLFATVATIVLQEMAARLGVAGRLGLGEALRRDLTGALRWPLFALVGIGLFLGNAAYEGGNLAGAALGVEALAGTGLFTPTVAVTALAAAALLLTGSYRAIEKVLIALVALMALAFVGTAVLVRPDLGALATGLTVPSVPGGSILTVVALIGTTIVPYNLFLHAAAAKNRWSSADDLTAARRDTGLSIGIGGLVAMLIVSTAAASLFAAGLKAESAADLAVQLRPIAGDGAPLLLGIGLFAAGLTSSITAPLATGYAVAEILGWRSDAGGWPVKGIALVVILVGAATALTGVRPIEIILAAQVANGLLLPIIAGFLLFSMNRARLGVHANGPIVNAAGLVIIAVTLLLGGRAVGSALGFV
ncbi:MAG: Nramp family divalent metal transporter, partial [Pseudomonadota bacterium]